jgi:alpha-L-rhamnosidase
MKVPGVRTPPVAGSGMSCGEPAPFGAPAGGEELVSAKTLPAKLLAVATVLATTVCLTVSVSESSATTARYPQWPTRVDWQSYVMAPRSASVTPVRVVRTSGSVKGVRSFTGTPGGRITLTATAHGPSPTIVFDYGRDVGGVPYFVASSESGSPMLHSAYSEGLQYLGPQGDGGPSASDAGDASRADDLTIANPGTLTTGLIQGGERYELVSLTSPGTVTLSSLGIRFTPVRAVPGDYRGWFASSSLLLNRIWYDGAYTTQLDELRPRSVPPPWNVDSGALVSVGGKVGVLDRGAGWSDYTMSFDVRAADATAGWVVRASSPSSAYLFILHEPAPASDSPDTLREVALGPHEFSFIADIDLPRPVHAVDWQSVKTVTFGGRITTSIDGRVAATFDTAALAPGVSAYARGTVGFATLGSEAAYKDLEVTSPDGRVLFASALSKPSALKAFSGPDVDAPDPLPMIVDGAKRDRVVWSADLGVEVPNVMYTTAASSYVRDSLELLGSYQVADGESGTNVDPTSPLATFPQSGSTYSASYSMDEVDNIATYYLYSGDLSFVRSEWPMITRELSFNRSLIDSRGLLVTDAGDGQDWDYYDGEKTGEVTAYNVIYYETLSDAASLAAALGMSAQAARYSQEAESLRTAVNRYLFDPLTDLYGLSAAQPDVVAEDANSLAVLFGIAPPNKSSAILDALDRALPSTLYGPLAYSADSGMTPGISPYVTNEEVLALFSTGDSSEALRLITTLWGHMDAPGPDYTGADWEFLAPDGSPGFGGSTSLAHGWSSGATAALSAYVLGAAPSTPGFATWSVKPHPGSLSWTEGEVPTPHGPLAVRWAHDDSGSFSLSVSAPSGTSGDVSVPVPTMGAQVRIRTQGEPGPGRVLHSAPGSSYLSVRVKGGDTYNFYVAPS